MTNDNRTSPAPEEKTKATSRRDFMTVSGALVAGAAMAGCAAGGRGSAMRISPMDARSYGRVIGANDRINVGVVGTGGMGGGHVRMITNEDFRKANNVQVTAVCDVYQPRLDRAVKDSEGAKPFRNYQDLLAGAGVDCVFVTTPEHWHTEIALDAETCGMDVYCQKPMTRTYDEAKRLYHRFKDSGRVFQVGSQYMQVPVYWRAHELFQKLLAEGKIRQKLLVTTGYSRNSTGGEWNYDIDKGARPGDDLDWRGWLGPLPYMEWDPQYYFRWRKYKEFSSGPISDLLVHKLHAIQYVMGPAPMPVKATAVGGIFVHPDRTVPDTVQCSLQYPDYTLMMFSSTANSTMMENIVRCHEADLVMDIDRGTIAVIPQRGVASTDFRQIKEETPEPKEGPHQIHMKEFFDGMRTRKQPTWSIEPAYRLMTAIAMCQEAYETGRTVYFDEKKERTYTM